MDWDSQPLSGAIFAVSEKGLLRYMACTILGLCNDGPKDVDRGTAHCGCEAVPSTFASRRSSGRQAEPNTIRATNRFKDSRNTERRRSATGLTVTLVDGKILYMHLARRYRLHLVPDACCLQAHPRHRGPRLELSTCWIEFATCLQHPRLLNLSVSRWRRCVAFESCDNACKGDGARSGTPVDRVHRRQTMALMKARWQRDLATMSWADGVRAPAAQWCAGGPTHKSKPGQPCSHGH